MISPAFGVKTDLRSENARQIKADHADHRDAQHPRNDTFHETSPLFADCYPVAFAGGRARGSGVTL